MKNICGSQEEVKKEFGLKSYVNWFWVVQDLGGQGNYIW